MLLNPIVRTILVVAGSTIAVTHPSVRAQRPEPRHVVMISIDGLKPSTYATAGPSKVPTLRRLAKDGAYAEGVVGVITGTNGRRPDPGLPDAADQPQSPLAGHSWHGDNLACSKSR